MASLTGLFQSLKHPIVSQNAIGDKDKKFTLEFVKRLLFLKEKRMEMQNEKSSKKSFSTLLVSRKCSTSHGRSTHGTCISKRRKREIEA